MLENAGPRRDATPEVLQRLGLACLALVTLTYGLIVLGALVRARGAGLACPDWPLCFGQVVPTMDVKVAFEWSHRAVAGGVALIFVAIGARTLRIADSGDVLRRLLGLSAVLLAVQILLGALTVWQLLASWTVTAHLLTGNAFAATLGWMALELRDRRSGRRWPTAATGLRRGIAIVGLLLFVQMLLGGLVSSRYAGLACPEWPTCNAGVWFPSWQGTVGLHLLHRANGYLLGIGLAIAAWRCRGTGRLARFVGVAAALGLAQLCVGIANVWLAIPVEVTGLHSALAAALVLVWTAAWRETRGRAGAG